MRRWWRILAGTLLMAVMLAGNVGVVRAHKWGNYHWNKSGPSIVIQNFIFGTNQTAAEAARQDGWNKIGILYNYRVNYHTDISVFDGNYGATGWAGLASLEDFDWDWGVVLVEPHRPRPRPLQHLLWGQPDLRPRGVLPGDRARLGPRPQQHGRLHGARLLRG